MTVSGIKIHNIKEKTGNQSWFIRVWGGVSLKKQNIFIVNDYPENSKKISHPAKIYANHKTKHLKGTPPCTRVKASYMVEAAVILPVFASFMLLFLFFFRILQVEQAVGGALADSSRKLAVIAAMQGEKKEAKKSNTAIGLAMAELAVHNEIKGQEVISFIQGGAFGIHLIKSDFSGDHIILRADYAVKIPIGLLKARTIELHQCVKIRKWTGESSDNAANREEMVYITKNGTVYHRNRDCTYLKPSVKKTMGSELDAKRNAGGAKYYPCEKCVKKKKPNHFVYITDYGNRYHNALSCSELERIIYMIRVSEAADRRACSKCKGD